MVPRADTGSGGGGGGSGGGEGGGGSGLGGGGGRGRPAATAVLTSPGGDTYNMSTAGFARPSLVPTGQST